jgi:hypothetical protein
VGKGDRARLISFAGRYRDRIAELERTSFERLIEPEEAPPDVELRGETAPSHAGQEEQSSSTMSDGSAWRQEPLAAQAATSPDRSQTLGNGDAFKQSTAPDADRFFEASYDRVLESMIAEVVLAEGPLPLSLLGCRVSALHGWQRTGRRIAERVRNALREVDIRKEGDVEFVWSKGAFAERIAYRPGMDRNVRDISRSEIASLYDVHARVLDRSEDPTLELARLAGIARLSSDARNYLDDCLRWRRETGQY